MGAAFPSFSLSLSLSLSLTLPHKSCLTRCPSRKEPLLLLLQRLHSSFSAHSIHYVPFPVSTHVARKMDRRSRRRRNAKHDDQQQELIQGPIPRLSLPVSLACTLRLPDAWKRTLLLSSCCLVKRATQRGTSAVKAQQESRSRGCLQQEYRGQKVKQRVSQESRRGMHVRLI